MYKIIYVLLGLFLANCGENPQISQPVAQVIDKIDLNLSETTSADCGLGLDKSKLTRLDPKAPEYLRDFFLTLRPAATDYSSLKCAESLASDMVEALSSQKASFKLVPTPLHYDVAIIGSGVQGAIFARNFSLKYPSKKIVVIDSGDMPASHFRSYAYFINSPENLTAPERETRISASANIFPGIPVQINDLYPNPNKSHVSLNKFVPAIGLWAETIFSAYFSAADYLMGKKIRKIRKITQGSDSIYEIGLGKNKITARKIIIATGLGRAKWLPIEDNERSHQLDLMAQCKRGECELPQIMQFADFFDLSKKRNLMEQLANKDVAVIGSGDSGKITIEYLIGQAPQIGYGKAEQDFLMEQLKSLSWINVKFDNFADFSKHPDTKMRYKIPLFEQLFTNQELLKFDGTVFEPSRKINIEFIKQMASFLQIDDAKKVIITYKDGSKSKPFDHVILALGYASENISILRSLGLIDRSAASFKDLVEIYPHGEAANPLALKLIGEEVYFIGTAANVEGIFPSKEQLNSSKTKNAHSINVLSPITKQFVDSGLFD